MKLHRLRLRSYRGVVDREVLFAEEGVTVIEGPNEVGKTCIPESVALIFDMLDSSRAAVSGLSSRWAETRGPRSRSSCRPADTGSSTGSGGCAGPARR